MRFVFLSTPPTFSVMVTCPYHPVPPCRQASSAGSPHRQGAPSASLLISSPSTSAWAATGLAARASAASAAPTAAASADSLTNRRGNWRIVASEGQKKKKTRDNYRDNSRDN